MARSRRQVNGTVLFPCSLSWIRNGEGAVTSMHPLCGAWRGGIYLVFLVLGIMANMPYTASAQLCTQRVKVEAGKSMQRVPMLRRIPAQCSNWDKSWVWLTQLDCGTKYVTDWVEFPSRVPTYRIEYVCCPSDSECKRAAEGRSSLDEDDVRFLAIVFGSATGVLALICLIFFITFCRQRHNRPAFCRKRREDYDSTEGIDALGCTSEAAKENQYVDEDMRLLEPQYEEITDKHDRDCHSGTEATPVKDGCSSQIPSHQPLTPTAPLLDSAPIGDYSQGAPSNISTNQNPAFPVEKGSVRNRIDSADLLYLAKSDCDEVGSNCAMLDGFHGNVFDAVSSKSSTIDLQEFSTNENVDSSKCSSVSNDERDRFVSSESNSIANDTQTGSAPADICAKGGNSVEVKECSNIDLVSSPMNHTYLNS